MSETVLKSARASTTIARLALLGGGLLCAALLIRYLPLDQQSALLREWVIGRGWRGIATFIAIGGLLCCFGIPRQAVSFAAGYAAGAWAGIALAIPAELIGCALNMIWAATIARDWASRHLPRRLARLSAFLTLHPFNATLIIRLLPVGNNLALNILAGMIGIPALPYLAASAIGYLPQTLIFALLGSGAQVGQVAQIAVAVGLFVASAVLGWFLLRRHRAIL